MNQLTNEDLAALCIFPTNDNTGDYLDESDYSKGETRRGDLHTLLLVRANILDPFSALLMEEAAA